MNTADRIQHLRKAKGISQEELADRIGVSRQAVSKWESEQSLPDIDKIIIMSDYFEVTTDYILKGVEPDGPAAKRPKLDANIFVATSTMLNFVGLIVSCAVWHGYRFPISYVAGLIFMAVGCMQFSIGHAFSNQNMEKAKRLFWMINIWILAFIPMSGLYNMIFSRMLAPYPLFEGYSQNLVAFPVFWMVYAGVCAAVFLKARRLEYA